MLNITSRNNAVIKNTIKLKNDAKQRRKQGLFLAEGLRLCKEAVLSEAEIEAVFISESAREKYSAELGAVSEKALRSYQVTDSIFSTLSDTGTPQGVLCVIKTLDKRYVFDKIKCNGKFLLLENIQDPNNLGAILRTADALNLNGVYLSADCCDIYNPKVVRGSMGAVFRVPFLYIEDVCKLISMFNKTGTTYAAALTEKAEDISAVQFDRSSMVAIGNEGNGLKQQTIDLCVKQVIIPMNPKAESFNAAVAASIFMWEMMK